MKIFKDNKKQLNINPLVVYFIMTPEEKEHHARDIERLNRSKTMNHNLFEFNTVVRARVYVGPFTFNTGFLTTAPDGLRLNIANVGAKYQQGAFSAVAEYYYRHYAHGLHPATHGYVVYGDYKHAMKSRLFNRWSVQARVDGMTHCWASRRDDNGQIEIELDNPQRNRITLGAMVSHIGFKGVDVHFQLNYEKFFWGHHHPGSIDNNDKIVAELQVCF